MLQEAIKKVVERCDLSEQEMSAAMTEIMDGRASDALISAFLTALRMKGETVAEITAAARVMRQKALTLQLASRDGLVDIVGTGGDGTGTFNISTAASFVAAGAGLRVAKHGNRSVSSRCGSADVMEALGIAIDISPQSVGKCIEEIGIGFLFAPTFHRAMKHAAPVRKALGIRTIFNILGPLTNPADTPVQLVGVYDSILTETIAHVLLRLGRVRALAVHSDDGLDEISVCAATHVFEVNNGSITQWTLNPEEYGISLCDHASLQGGSASDNASIIHDLLNGKAGPYRDCVVLNAGAAIMISGAAGTLHDGVQAAAAAIDSGAALRKLEELKHLSNRFAQQ